MLAKAGPNVDLIATPPVCLYIVLLKLNSTEDVALFINSKKHVFWNDWFGIRLVIEGFRTVFDGFIKGNVGKRAGHIKRTHEDIRVDVKILHGLSKRKRICVFFGKPYIPGLCDPVGRIASYIHFGLRSALTKSSNRF